MMRLTTNFQRVLTWLDTLRRDLLTERRAAHRPYRYIPAGEAERPVIEMRAVTTEPTGTSAVQTEDEDVASNYYIIIHCAKCGEPVQARKKGSKGKIIRICAACAAALRRRGRAA